MSSYLLKQKPLIEKFLNEETHEHSAFSFVNIFAWEDFFDFKLETIDDCLCIFAFHQAGLPAGQAGCFLYLPPLGKKISRECIEQCFEIMAKTNRIGKISRVENVTELMLGSFSSPPFSCFKKADEYIYNREDIASLQGNLFKSKRSLYNYFLKQACLSGRQDGAQFEVFDTGMMVECLKLYDEWAGGRAAKYSDGVYRQMLEENRRVHRKIMEFSNPLGLVGRVVRVDGKIKAYTFGFKLNKEMFCVLLEVADLNIKGLAVYIFKEFCQDPALSSFKWINVMDDFGLDNIKKTKLSFRPHRLISSYVVSKT